MIPAFQTQEKTGTNCQTMTPNLTADELEGLKVYVSENSAVFLSYSTSPKNIEGGFGIRPGEIDLLFHPHYYYSKQADWMVATISFMYWETWADRGRIWTNVGETDQAWKRKATFITLIYPRIVVEGIHHAGYSWMFERKLLIKLKRNND